MRLVAGAALAVAACGAPRIDPRGEHEAMAPGTPDQICLLCHREGSDQGEPPSHAVDEAHDGCTGCHGPRHPAAPRMVVGG